MKKAAPILALIGAFSQVVIPLALVIPRFTLSDKMFQSSLNGSDDIPEVTKMIGAVQQAMDSIVYQVAIGLGLALVGVLLFILAITAGKYRKTWAFWFACIYGGCLLLMFPVGLPFGVFLLVYALSKRNEFLSPRVSSVVLTK